VNLCSEIRLYLCAMTEARNHAKQERYDRAYLKMALEWSKLSHCKRKQVGALLVKDGMIISDGYNGTPSGFPNHCEDDHGDTLWYVLHAEANAILKVARSANSAKGSTLYITLSPCKECCKLILQAGIERMVYQVAYKDPAGLDFLREAGLNIIQIENV
jgi:dCMP deaminase